MNMEIKELFNILPAKSVYSVWLFKSLLSFTWTPFIAFNLDSETPILTNASVLGLFFFSFLSEIQTKKVDMSWVLPSE